jgi:hypothetical protein
VRVDDFVLEEVLQVRLAQEPEGERESFLENLLVQIQFIIEMIWWTGLAPWEFEFPSLRSLISTFLVNTREVRENRGSASKRRGNDAKGFEDFNLRAKARSWPCLSHVSRDLWRG